MAKVDANFYFKIFGLTHDEDGNLGYGYINVSPKTKDDKVSKIEEEQYADMHDTFAKVVSKQLDIDLKDVILITEQEYLEKTEENE